MAQSGVINELRVDVGIINRGTVPAAAAAAPDTTSASGRAYTLEVRDASGAWLANILRWRSGKRRARANEFDTIALEVPGDDEAVAYLAFPNEIWLYAGDYAEAVSKCTIMAVQHTVGIGHWVAVECEGLLGQLGRELVTSYATPVTTEDDGTTTYETKTLLNIVGDVLANNQSQSPPIGVGKFDPELAAKDLSVRFDNLSILECLRRLQKITGGYFSVDTNRKVQWRSAAGFDEGHWIKFGHNLVSCEVRSDYRQIQTEVTAFGAGKTPETRTQSVADDTAAQAEYGVIRGVVYFDNTTEQETLDKGAASALAKRKGPKTTYRVDVVNLGALDASSYNFESGMLHVGSRVGLYLDSPAVSITTTVLAMEWDLDQPLNVQIEFSDPDVDDTDGSKSEGSKTLLDYVADALEELESAKTDAGVALAVARSYEPPTEDITRTYTQDNLFGDAADKLGEDYGETTVPQPDVDAFSDALWDRLIDALTDATHPKYDALRTAMGALGEANIWVPFTGS